MLPLPQLHSSVSSLCSRLSKCYFSAMSCTESGDCYLFTVREMGKYIYKWKQKWRKNWREHIIHVWSNTARNIIWLAMRLHYTILMFLKKTVQMNTYQTIIFSYNYAHPVHRNNKWWLTKYQWKYKITSVSVKAPD